MNSFHWQSAGKELQPFPHIIELAFKKVNTIQFDSFRKNNVGFFRFYQVVEGKFEWVIDHQHHVLYPGDVAVILPGQPVGGAKDFMDIGAVAWLHVRINNNESKKKVLGSWSGLPEHDGRAVLQLLLANGTPVLSRIKDAAFIFQLMAKEITAGEVGYTTRVNGLLDELLISIARHLTREKDSRKDFPQTFLKLEQQLRGNLSHQWTVEDMAAIVGLGTTAFSEKVKNFTGFAPLHYLINIRISEAIKLLKQKDVNVTDIALDVGFYSSQHFATTFKKLTGYTPREFRKENTSDH